MHPSLGMQVDAKCVIWQKCGGVRNIPPIFVFYTKAGDTDRWGFQTQYTPDAHECPLFLSASL